MVTVRNLVAGLSRRFHFKVLTANHDLGDIAPYPGIQPNRWSATESGETSYISADWNWSLTIARQLSGTDFDLLHLNTIFSRPFGIAPLLLRRFGAIPRRPVIVAPRGELAAGALAIKFARKRSFLRLARECGIFNDVWWQATCEDEAEDIRAHFGAEAKIGIAPDLLSADYQNWETSRYRKCKGQIDIIFLGRISPKKNLHLALEALRGLEGQITFRIVGPIDDSRYWESCRRLIATLDTNIRTEYLGPVAGSEVNTVFANHGLLLLPTANENFGFVILEALLAGCPVLISDQTPWRDLQNQGAGWDVPLSRFDLMRSILQDCIAMDAATHRELSVRARECALDYLARDNSADRNAGLFNSVLASDQKLAAIG